MKKIFLVGVAIFILSCSRKEDNFISCHVIYKYTNPEYRSLCFVGMSTKTEGKVDIYKTPQDYEGSKELVEGYIIDKAFYNVDEKNNITSISSSQTYGSQTAICSISRTEFHETWDFDKLINSVIDTEPFEVFYLVSHGADSAVVCEQILAGKKIEDLHLKEIININK